MFPNPTLPMPSALTHYNRPFIYIYDASGLTDGQSYSNLQIDLQRDYPFGLYRFAGLETCADPTTGLIQILDAQRGRLSSLPLHTMHDWPFAPCVEYPADGQIAFGLTNVLRASNAFLNGEKAYTSQLCFQGMKRVYGGQQPYTTAYPYYEKTQVYSKDITVDWTNKVSPAFTVLNSARDFVQNIETRDFELLYINLLISNAGGGVNNFFTSEGCFGLELFDVMGFPFQNAPVADRYLTYLNSAYNCGFPNPPVVWPANSVIKFRVTSYLTDLAPISPSTLRIEFHGINRMPLDANNTTVSLPGVAGLRHREGR